MVVGGRLARLSTMFMVGMFIVSALASLPSASATTTETLILTPGQVDGAGPLWTDAGLALVDDDAAAWTTVHQHKLEFIGYDTTETRTIERVDFVVRGNQLLQLDDQVKLIANTWGCGPQPTMTTQFTWFTAEHRYDDVPCSGGWTWQKLLESWMGVQTSRQGLLVDGAWQVEHAWLEVTVSGPSGGGSGGSGGSTTSNAAPSADAGVDQYVDERTTVTLQGSGSDPDGDPLTLTWLQTSGPSVGAPPLGGTWTFSAPGADPDGDLTLSFQLTTTDLLGLFDTDTVDVVVAHVNQAPWADAGEDQSVGAGATVTLDGSQSEDPDGEAFSYAWIQTGGTTVTLMDPATPSPSFVAPQQGAALTFRLTTTDIHGLTGTPDSVTVTVAAASGSGTGDGSNEPESNSGSTAPSDDDGTLGGLGDAVDDVVSTVGDVLTGLDDAPPATGGQGTVTPGPSAGSIPEAGDEPPKTKADVDDPALKAFLDDAGVPDEAPISYGRISLSGSLEVQEARSCMAELPRQYEADPIPMPVHLPGDCAIDLLVLDWDAPHEAVTMSVHVYDGLPSWAPNGDWEILPQEVVELRIDGDRMPDHITLHLAADTSWTKYACDGDCVASMYALTGDHWEALSTAEAPDGYVVSAGGHSMYVLAATALPAPPFNWWWVAAAAGVVAVVAIGYGIREKRKVKALQMVPAPFAKAPERPVPLPQVKPLEQELRNEELIQFLNNASHDLASPLTPIRLQLHMLQKMVDEGSGEQQKKALGVVKRNVEQMGLLIQDLKEASRLQAGHLELFPERTNVGDIIEGAVESFGPAAEEHDIRLFHAGRTYLPVMADAGRLNQVVYNLLTNAIKFTPPGGTIRIETAVQADMVQVRVIDSGLGMTQEQMDKLFKPFSQVHDAKQKKKGSGLGLYICKQVVELHKGRVGVASHGRGRGSTFWFQIPLEAAQAIDGRSKRLEAPMRGNRADLDDAPERTPPKAPTPVVPARASAMGGPKHHQQAVDN